MIQIGSVYTTFCQEDGILMQDVSRYFSEVLGSGVDLTILRCKSVDWLELGSSGPVVLAHIVQQEDCSPN